MYADLMNKWSNDRRDGSGGKGGVGKERLSRHFRFDFSWDDIRSLLGHERVELMGLE